MSVNLSNVKKSIKSYLGSTLEESEGILIDEIIAKLRLSGKYQIFNYDLGGFTYHSISIGDGVFIIIPSYQQLLELRIDLESIGAMFALQARMTSCGGNFAWRNGIKEYTIKQNGESFFELPYVIVKKHESN